jgi:uncharacterized protein YkwD
VGVSRGGREGMGRRAVVTNAVGLLLGAVLLLGALSLSPFGPSWGRERLDSALGGGASSGAYMRSPLPGEAAVFARRDGPWDSHLAPEHACPGSNDASATAAVQERTVACLLNWARHTEGLGELPVSPLLSRAAVLKAEDIDRCDDFAHEACGKAAHAVVGEAGYPQSAWGENLYTGSRQYASPREAVRGWLHSDGHRENLLNPAWTEQGLALRTGTRGGHPASIWVSHFSDRAAG